jgi:quinoprotein glucose dehydrogenase
MKTVKEAFPVGFMTFIWGRGKLPFGLFASILFFGSSPVSAWQAYGGPGAMHYTDLEQVNKSNVAGLKEVWTARTGELEQVPEAMHGLLSFQATPLKLPAEAGGSLLVCTQTSRVVALNPATGEQRWLFDPEIKLSSKRALNCRGLAYAKVAGSECLHRVFVATHDRRLFALDVKNGQRCSDFADNGKIDLHRGDFERSDVSHPSPPMVINDTLVLGSGIIDFAKARAPTGNVQAYDIKTGELRWVFDLIPEVSEDRNEWPERPQEVSGAANVWAPISVDAERDMVFLPSSSPSSDYYGANRPGNNGYANSVIALRASTGEVLWSFQGVHHDLWDYDMPAQPILTDIEHEGKTVPVVIQLTKQGFVFVLHRETGEPVWPVEERPVPQTGLPEEKLSPTQPFALKPERMLPDRLPPEKAWGLTFWDRGKCREILEQTRHEGLFTPLNEEWTLMLPGSLGGANWGGAAIDPVRQRLIVNFSTTPSRARLVRREGEIEKGKVAIEGYNWRMQMQGTPYDMEVGMLMSPWGVPCSPPPWGKLAALDLRSGEWEWQVPFGSIHDLAPIPLPFHINWGTPNLGGGVLLKSGVFFIAATSDKTFRAFDSESGEILWKTALPLDAMATPTSYMHEGRQYVVLSVGGHHMFDRGKGDYIKAYALPK